jgi:hypothetical protein
MDTLIKDKQSNLDRFDESLLDRDAGKFSLAGIQRWLSCPTVSIQPCSIEFNRFQVSFFNFIRLTHRHQA